MSKVLRRAALLLQHLAGKLIPTSANSDVDLARPFVMDGQDLLNEQLALPAAGDENGHPQLAEHSKTQPFAVMDAL